MMYSPVLCKATVLRYVRGRGGHVARCSRRAERAGFCWQHHPMRVNFDRAERIRKSGRCPTCGQEWPQ